MRLYLARHAEAAPKQRDEYRGLTPKGARDAQAVAECIKLLGLKVDSIWHSGKARSVQTAEILASALHARRSLMPRADINPNSPVRPVAKQIQRACKNLMIVGHEPFLGELACKLLGHGTAPAMLDLAKASILCLEYRDDCGWQIEWMVNPEIAYAVFAKSS
jgi:phosphohistidine phosphatase